MKWGPFFLLLSIFTLPSISFAQVVINEVMYNPAGSDTGREWVELYNEGQSDVTMVGGSGKGSWRISDGSNHTLTDPESGTGRGSLTIPAGGYLVIASDPTDFISGEYAGGTYSVVKSSISLNNNGATLTLLDGTGATVDTFSYTPSQGGNDDGTSLQKQADGSWIAALPTPGSSNSTTPYAAPPPEDTSTTAPDETDTTAATTTQTQSQATDLTSSYVAPPAPSLYANAGGDRTVIVGADVEFDASAYDRTQTLLDPSTVRFMWNFGDGSTAEGAAVLHHFSYPGSYAVVLDIADDKNAATDQISVTAQPAALSFTLLPDGGVQIQDLAGHDLDLSDWVVRESDNAFAAQFVLPDNSKVLSGSSMQISAQTLQFRASSSTMLEYPNGALALAAGESFASSTLQGDPTQSAAQVANSASAASAPVAPPQPKNAIALAISDDTVQSDSIEPGPDTATDTGDAEFSPVATSAIIQTAAASVAAPPSYIWWLGIVAFVLAIGAAIVAASYFKKGEWDIVEDKSE